MVFWQLPAVAFAMALQISAAAINCTDQSVTLVVTDNGVHNVEGFCTLPQGGCSNFSVSDAEWWKIGIGGIPLQSYDADRLINPILGLTKTFVEPDGRVKLESTFRGFDNIITTRTFTQKLTCNTRVGGIVEMQWYNVTVHMSKSSADAAALVPPERIPVGCLVENTEAWVLVNFEAPNASAKYHRLVGHWSIGDDLPWDYFYSRPAKAFNSGHTIQSIRAGPNSSSLWLVLKPPMAWDASQHSDAKYWEDVCIYPGDGYNYFPALCAGYFPVVGVKSQAECDGIFNTSTNTTSTTSMPPDALSTALTPKAALLALATAAIALLVAVLQDK